MRLWNDDEWATLRTDRVALSKMLKDAGFKHEGHYSNGKPEFKEPADMERVQAIAMGGPVDPPSPATGVAPATGTPGLDPPKKHPGGKPKGSKNKPK